MDPGQWDVAGRTGNGMKATTKLLLPADVAVAPIASLPLELNHDLAEEAGGFYVTRADTESDSMVVDAQTAALLEHFRAPSTVIDAIMAFCRAHELDPTHTLDAAFRILADLVDAGMLVPASAHKQWATFRYCENYRNQFTEEECGSIVSLHHDYSMVASKIDSHSGDPIRDCNLFWIPRNGQTDWIFSRLWKLGETFNERYGFELSPEMGMAQLTRYTPGQQYKWHMDVGPKEASVRKISTVLQLSSSKDMQGGGTEVFYGDSIDNRIDADIGDVVVFPSFVIHRASMVHSGIRWSLVLWLTGPQPLR
jgi:hypothetical protein